MITLYENGINGILADEMGKFLQLFLNQLWHQVKSTWINPYSPDTLISELFQTILIWYLKLCSEYPCWWDWQDAGNLEKLSRDFNAP